MKTIRVLALSLTLGIWASVSVDALNAKQIAQVSTDVKLNNQGIVDRSQDGSLNLLGSNQQRSVNCNSDAVQITGNRSTITLEGTCSEVTLVGNDNVIQTKTVGIISVTGNNNQVTWSNGVNGGTPRISRSGNDNVITQAK